MRDKDERKSVIGFTNNKAENNQDAHARENISNQERDDYRRLERIMQVFPRIFPDALDIVMKEYEIREYRLAEDSDLDEKTIVRMRTRLDYKPKLQTIIQLCIGLKVPSIICLELIRVAGFTLHPYGVELAYYCIITQKVVCTLQDCNEYLVALGYSPLGRGWRVA